MSFTNRGKLNAKRNDFFCRNSCFYRQKCVESGLCHCTAQPISVKAIRSCDLGSAPFSLCLIILAKRFTIVFAIVFVSRGKAGMASLRYQKQTVSSLASYFGCICMEKEENQKHPLREPLGIPFRLFTTDVWYVSSKYLLAL